MVIKSGFVVESLMEDANASILAPQPVISHPSAREAWDAENDSSG